MKSNKIPGNLFVLSAVQILRKRLYNYLSAHRNTKLSMTSLKGRNFSATLCKTITRFNVDL